MNEVIAHDEALRHEGVELTEDMEEIVESERIFLSKMTPMQRSGLAFMLLRERESKHAQYGGFLCDALGSGKSFLSLALIALTIDPERKRKTLIVAPASVIHTWKNECERHIAANFIRLGIYHGPHRRENLERFWNSHDVFITSYGTLASEIVEISTLPVNGDQFNAPMGGRSTQVDIEGFKYRDDSLLMHNKDEDGANFHRIILDEAHHARNLKTKASRAVMTLAEFANCKWCVTATPVWNSIDDIYPLVKFLGAYPLADRMSWLCELNDRHFSYQHEVLPKLLHFLRPIMIRRDKSSLNLPPRNEQVVHIELGEAERLFYEALYSNSRARVTHLLSMETSMSENAILKTMRRRLHMTVMCVFLRMRQACVHPQIVLDAYEDLWQDEGEPGEVMDFRACMTRAVERLREERFDDDCTVCMCAAPDHCAIPCGHRFCAQCFAILEAMEKACPMCRATIVRYEAVQRVLEKLDMDEDEDDEESLPTIETEWVEPSAKMRFIVEDMPKHPPQTKFIIFSQWVSVIDVFSRYFLAHEIKFLRIDGSLSLQRRCAVQKEFNEGSDHYILLVSLMSGSEGLNLQRASVVYFTDAWWTASRVDQASNRVHRLGQMRDVNVYHLVAKDTVEERAWQVQEEKRKLGSRIFGKEEGERQMMRYLFEI